MITFKEFICILKESEVVNLSDKRDEKRLKSFHSDMMGKIRQKASQHSDLVRGHVEAGKFPMEIGTRFTTDHSRKNNLPPMKITGYYVDPKNPEGRYGYHVERGKPDSEGHEKSMHMIRDPRLEKIHGPKKWSELQSGVKPFTGLKSV